MNGPLNMLGSDALKPLLAKYFEEGAKAFFMYMMEDPERFMAYLEGIKESNTLELMPVIADKFELIYSLYSKAISAVEGLHSTTKRSQEDIDKAKDDILDTLI